MRKRESSIVSLVFLILMFVFGGLYGCRQSQDDTTEASANKPIKIRIHSQLPIGHNVTNTIELFIQEAEKRSNGRLQFIHFPAQQLYKDTQTLDVISKGTIEMAQISPSMWAGVVSEMDMSWPTFFNDVDHFYRFLLDVEGGGGYVYKVLDPILQQKVNTKYIFSAAYELGGLGAIVLTEPCRSLEEFKGRKIRAIGKVSSLRIKLAGGVPVIMSAGDVYMALQRGTIEGAITGCTSWISRKLYEVAKYGFHLYSSSVGGIFPVVINAHFWNKLPKDLQLIILEAGKTAEISSAQQALEIHEECLVTLKEKGIVTFEASPEEKAMLWAESRPRFIKEMERDMGKSATKMYIQLAEASKKGTRTWKETCTARPLH
ncbi:MAG: TRAP transporter substrate-binding protein DctP [Thermodesulfobacteriota bacterium]|nr:TRAP transporter substrate-binding protein DctP [Thermodesulfobacteriota bacterium]